MRPIACEQDAERRDSRGVGRDPKNLDLQPGAAEQGARQGANGGGTVPLQDRAAMGGGFAARGRAPCQDANCSIKRRANQAAPTACLLRLGLRLFALSCL